MKAIIITFIATCAAFVISAIGASVLAHWLGIWNTLAVGVVVAPIVVLVAYWTTKRRKVQAAAIAYVVGSAAAIYLLKRDYYPEPYDRAYEPTIIPLATTLLSGACALLALVLIRSKNETGA